MLNETDIIQSFYSYYEELNINDTLASILEGCTTINEATVEQNIWILENVLVPEVAVLFANKWVLFETKYSKQNQDLDLNNLFGTFCTFENLDESVVDTLARVVNTGAAMMLVEEDNDNDSDDGAVSDLPYTNKKKSSKDKDDDDEDVDDNEFVFKRDEWSKSSDEDRLKKVKAFLRRIGTCHIDAREMSPFLKDLDVGTDSYGNKPVGKVTAFSRVKNRFGHPNELGNWTGPKNEDTIEESTVQYLPDVKNLGNPEEVTHHPLKSVLDRFGFSLHKTIPVNQTNSKIALQHIFKNVTGHLVSSYSNSNHWVSKTASQSGHEHVGRGSRDLQRHLERAKNRNKDESVCHTNILETLLDDYDRVAKYAEFMNKQHFGFEYDQTNSPKQNLLEAARAKKNSDAIFEYGKHPADYTELDARKGSSLRDKGKK